MSWHKLPCLWMYLVTVSVVLCRFSYLPEASNVALDVARYPLICMMLSVHQYLDHAWRIISTEVRRWLPYQTSVHLSVTRIWACVSIAGTPIAKQPKVIIVAELFYLFLVVGHVV